MQVCSAIEWTWEEGKHWGIWHKECGKSGTADLGVPDNWAEMTSMGVWEFLEGRLNQDLCCGTKYLLFDSHEETI